MVVTVLHPFIVALGWFSDALAFLNGLTYHGINLLYYLIGFLMLSIMIRRIFNN